MSTATPIRRNRHRPTGVVFVQQGERAECVDRWTKFAQLLIQHGQSVTAEGAKS